VQLIRFIDSGGKERRGRRIDSRSAKLIEGDILGDFRVTEESAQISKLLAPIVPRDILCIGLNYRKHAEETGAKVPENPVLFIKASSSLQNPGDPIFIPPTEPEVDYECELAVVIGKTARRVPAERALSHVLGYTCANDVSGRSWQIKRGGGQWCRGKSFETFCPLGPHIVTRDEIPDPNSLKIRTILNGETVQDWTTSDMIFNVPHLISFLSEGMTLHPGTVILTGTPQGVGVARKPPLFLKAGDEVTVEIEGIGRLENPVRAEA
jgi:2-keto-4-pentenoate hydratase/2-oxohepta-3-ene-1,7-dioic acid hydratase in catechol pathway